MLRGAARPVAGISSGLRGGERFAGAVWTGRGVRALGAWDLGGVGRVGQAGEAVQGKVAREKVKVWGFCWFSVDGVAVDRRRMAFGSALGSVFAFWFSGVVASLYTHEPVPVV